MYHLKLHQFTLCRLHNATVKFVRGAEVEHCFKSIQNLIFSQNEIFFFKTKGRIVSPFQTLLEKDSKFSQKLKVCVCLIAAKENAFYHDHPRSHRTRYPFLSSHRPGSAQNNVD